MSVMDKISSKYSLITFAKSPSVFLLVLSDLYMHCIWRLSEWHIVNITEHASEEQTERQSCDSRPSLKSLTDQTHWCDQDRPSDTNMTPATSTQCWLYKEKHFSSEWLSNFKLMPTCCLTLRCFCAEVFLTLCHLIVNRLIKYGLKCNLL